MKTDYALYILMEHRESMLRFNLDKTIEQVGKEQAMKMKEKHEKDLASVDAAVEVLASEGGHEVISNEQNPTPKEGDLMHQHELHHKMSSDELEALLEVYNKDYAHRFVHHTKSGGDYYVSGTTVMNVDGVSKFGLIYHPVDPETGRIIKTIPHTRPCSEFLDGRFVFGDRHVKEGVKEEANQGKVHENITLIMSDKRMNVSEKRTTAHSLGLTCSEFEYGDQPISEIDRLFGYEGGQEVCIISSDSRLLKFVHTHISMENIYILDSTGEKPRILPIRNTTGRVLRGGHNLAKLYDAGEFTLVPRK